MRSVACGAQRFDGADPPEAGRAASARWHILPGDNKSRNSLSLIAINHTHVALIQLVLLSGSGDGARVDRSRFANERGVRHDPDAPDAMHPAPDWNQLFNGGFTLRMSSMNSIPSGTRT